MDTATQKQLLNDAKSDVVQLLSIDSADSAAIRLFDDLRKLYEDNEEELDSFLKSSPNNTTSNSSSNQNLDTKNSDSTSTTASQDAAFRLQLEKREQSNVFKDQGNTAISNKDYLSAEKCYSNAIAIDATNMAAYNNRTMAYLKLLKFTEAEADASVVINTDCRFKLKPALNVSTTSAANVLEGEDMESTLQRYKKALYRRAQARQFQSKNDSKKLIDAKLDYEMLLKVDSSNKSAELELKKINATLNATPKVPGKQTTPTPGNPNSTFTPPIPPTTNPFDVSVNASKSENLLSERATRRIVPKSKEEEGKEERSSSPSPTSSIPMANSPTKAASVSSAGDNVMGSSGIQSPMMNAKLSGGGDTSSGNKRSSGVSGVSSPLTSFVLPDEPPKTAYEYVL